MADAPHVTEAEEIVDKLRRGEKLPDLGYGAVELFELIVGLLDDYSDLYDEYRVVKEMLDNG